MSADGTTDTTEAITAALAAAVRDNIDDWIDANSTAAATAAAAASIASARSSRPTTDATTPSRKVVTNLVTPGTVTETNIANDSRTNDGLSSGIATGSSVRNLERTIEPPPSPGTPPQQVPPQVPPPPPSPVRPPPPPTIVILPRDFGPITDPNINDVLSGRGKPINNHAGNVQHRSIIQSKTSEYLAQNTTAGKDHIVAGIVNAIRARNPAGRFLQQDNGTGLWFDIGDAEAIKKTRQSFSNAAWRASTTAQVVTPIASLLIQRYEIGTARHRLLPNHEQHQPIIPFHKSSNCLVPPDDTQVKLTSLNALLLQCNILDQQYEKITSQIYTEENQEELEEQQRIKDTIFLALTEEEKEGYGRLYSVDMKELSESIDEEKKVLHHKIFKNLYDSNLIRIIPANYLMDNRDPAMKNLHNLNRNLILSQNADHLNKAVYYATKDAFVISERLIITKKKSTNDRLLFVGEGLRRNVPVYYYKRYRVLKRSITDGYHIVTLSAKDKFRSGNYLQKERVGAIIFTVFSGRSRKEANQGGLRQTLDHITRNPSEDSYCYLRWADGSEQKNNQCKKRKRSPTHKLLQPKATEQDLAKEEITHFFRKHPTLDLLISHIHPTYIFDIEKQKFLNGSYTMLNFGPRRFITFQKKPLQVSRLSAETRIGRKLEQKEIVDHNDGNTINDSWDQIAVSTSCGNSINTNQKIRSNTGHRGISDTNNCTFRVTWTQGHHLERKYRSAILDNLEDAIEFRNLMYAIHMIPQVTDGRELNVAWNTYVVDQQKQIESLQFIYMLPFQHRQFWTQMKFEIIEEQLQQQRFLNDHQILPFPNYNQIVAILKQRRQELRGQLQQQQDVVRQLSLSRSTITLPTRSVLATLDEMSLGGSSQESFATSDDDSLEN